MLSQSESVLDRNNLNPAVLTVTPWIGRDNEPSFKFH